MDLHRRALPLGLILATLLLAAHSAAADWSLQTGSTHARHHAEGYLDQERLSAFQPGDPIGWLLATGEVGTGDIATIDSTSLTTTRGLRLDQSTCAALWRPDRSKATSVAQGLGYGLAVGALASTAVYANYDDDSASVLSDLGVGLLIGASLTGGLLGGLIVGAAAPPTEFWQLIYLAPGADESKVDLLPNPDGTPRKRWPDSPWLEVTPQLGAVGWNGSVVTSEHGGVRGAIWLPAARHIAIGVTVSSSASTAIEGSSNFSTSILARFGSSIGYVHPYLTLGAGWYGPLSESIGLSFGGGLRVPMGERWAVSLEAGAVSSTEKINGDRPGMASLGFGVSYSLGSGGGH